MEQTETEQMKGSSKKPLFTTLLILLVLAIGAYAYFGPKASMEKTQEDNSSSPAASAMVQEDVMNPNEGVSTESADSMMMDDESATGMVEVNMEGGAYYFQPNVINAKLGDTIRVTLTSVDMPHDFVLDEFNVQSKIVNQGNSTTVEFTADQAGEFQFYCSVGNHRAQGMVGTLVVQ